MSGEQAAITADQLLQLANTNATELDNVRLTVAWSNTKWPVTWDGVAKLLEQGLGHSDTVDLPRIFCNEPLT